MFVKRLAAVAFIVVALTGPATADAKGDWKDAKRSNTSMAYRSFIEKYPNHKLTTEAHAALAVLDEAAWNKALRSNSSDSYLSYISSFPNGVHEPEAVKLIDNLKLRDSERQQELERRSSMSEARLQSYMPGTTTLQLFRADEWPIAGLEPGVIGIVGFERKLLLRKYWLGKRDASNSRSATSVSSLGRGEVVTFQANISRSIKEGSPSEYVLRVSGYAGDQEMKDLMKERFEFLEGQEYASMPVYSDAKVIYVLTFQGDVLESSERQ